MHCIDLQTFEDMIKSDIHISFNVRIKTCLLIPLVLIYLICEEL